ncbi:MAG: hypothetical protein ACE366_01690 [Bradymonadia bacterium]
MRTQPSTPLLFGPTAMCCAASLAFAFTGCGTEHDFEPATADAHGHSQPCIGEHDHYRPGMQRLTEAGLYAIELRDADAPAANDEGVIGHGEHRFHLWVLNPISGAPRPDLALEVELVSPEGEAPEVPLLQMEPAVYRFTADMYAEGLWQLDLHLEGSQPDVLRLTFCVE